MVFIALRGTAGTDPFAAPHAASRYTLNIIAALIQTLPQITRSHAAQAGFFLALAQRRSKSMKARSKAGYKSCRRAAKTKSALWSSQDAAYSA